MLVLAKRFADETLDPVASYRTANDAGGDRKSKAGNACAGVARENREAAVGETARIAIDAIELGLVPQALCRLERPRESWQVRVSNARAGAARSDGEALAALRATTRQNLATGASGHARAKAVSALTMYFARLVCTLHAGSRRKSALKQAHGGLKRRAARVRSNPRGVKQPVEDSRARRCAPLTEKSRSGPVDNPRRIGIDSPSSRVDLAQKNSSDRIRGRNRAGFVMAPLSRSIGSGTA
jgi:hypothetical protein